jgi:perosamine synthetase
MNPPPVAIENRRISWFVYAVRLSSAFGQSQRDAIIRLLAAQGINCGRYFAPLHWQPVYQHQPVRHSLPVTESLSTRSIALPFFNNITESEIECVRNSLVQVATRVLDEP